MRYFLVLISLLFVACCHKPAQPAPERFSVEKALACTWSIKAADGRSGGTGWAVLNRPGRALTLVTANHILRRKVPYLASLAGGPAVPVVPMRQSKKLDIAVVMGMPPSKAGCEAPIGSDVLQGDRVWATAHPPRESAQVVDGVVRSIIRQSSRRTVFTNTIISPGWSGGPLWDARGRVVGMHQSTAGYYMKVLGLVTTMRRPGASNHLHRDEIVKFLTKVQK